VGRTLGLTLMSRKSRITSLNMRSNLLWVSQKPLNGLTT
jgi:hypothetical protein